MAAGRSRGFLCRCPAEHLYAMSTLAHPTGLILLQASANLHAVNCEPFVLMSFFAPFSLTCGVQTKGIFTNVQVQIKNCLAHMLQKTLTNLRYRFCRLGQQRTRWRGMSSGGWGVKGFTNL